MLSIGQPSKWAFTHPFAANYDPLTFFSHSLDVRMFELDAGRHHQVNVVLHALNAVLLFWVLKRATGFTGRSFMVAALFAVHPIQVENVAWIAERKTILSTVFFLLALGAYRWYACKPVDCGAWRSSSFSVWAGTAGQAAGDYSAVCSVAVGLLAAAPHVCHRRQTPRRLAPRSSRREVSLR